MQERNNISDINKGANGQLASTALPIYGSGINNLNEDENN